MNNHEESRVERVMQLAEERGYVVDEGPHDHWFVFDLADNSFVTYGKGMTLKEVEEYIEQASA